MSKRGPENILLLVPEACRARLVSVLAPLTAHVWPSPQQVPAGVVPEIVVIDGATDRTAADAPLLGGANTAGGAGGTVGVVAIGHDPADRAETPGPVADVVLAPDFTDRELRITCRLVARIARLRAELAAGARREAAVRQIAETDPLTGLANRRAWERYLEGLVHESAAVERWLAVVDLDNFKQVNDRAGMARGDEVLKRTAQALARQLRRDDLIVRLGGDEFGVVLCQVSEANVRSVFERLRAAVATECAQAGAPQVTASIGYVPLELPIQGGAAERLLPSAEKAMRVAKRLGGNRVVVFGNEAEPA